MNFAVLTLLFCIVSAEVELIFASNGQGEWTCAEFTPADSLPYEKCILLDMRRAQDPSIQTWKGAEKACRDLGGNLPTVRSEAEKTDFIDFLTELQNNGTVPRIKYSVWLGVTADPAICRTGPAGTDWRKFCSIAPGGSWEPMPYNFFLPPNPSGSGGQEHCVHVIIAPDGNMQFNDVKCDIGLYGGHFSWGALICESRNHKPEYQKCLDETRQCAYGPGPCSYGPFGYNGTKSTTLQGKKCVAWAEQTWHPEWQEKMKDMKNYCRDPNGREGPWCYTTISGRKHWNYCFEQCPERWLNGKCGQFLKPYKTPEHLQVVEEKVWYDGYPDPSNDDQTDLENVQVSLLYVLHGKTYVFKIDNWTPRAFAQLKVRIHFKNITRVPHELIIPGPIDEWKKYRYIVNLDDAEIVVGDVNKIQVIFMNPWWITNAKTFEHDIRRGFHPTEINLVGWSNLAEYKKTFARWLGDIKFIVNRPDFRKHFFDEGYDPRKWTKWERKNIHNPGIVHNWFDRALAQKKDLKMIVMSGGLGVAGGSWLGIASYKHRYYAEQGFWTGYAVLFHEVAHNQGFPDYSFVATTMHGRVEGQGAYYLNQKCVFQHFKAPLERYEDSTLVHAAWNAMDGKVYFFSAYHYHIMNFATNCTGSSSCINEAEQCIDEERQCVNVAACSSLSSYSGRKNTTMSNLPCQAWDEDTPNNSTHTELGDNNFCRVIGDDHNQPWCYWKDKRGWQNCFPECPRLPRYTYNKRINTRWADLDAIRYVFPSKDGKTLAVSKYKLGETKPEMMLEYYTLDGNPTGAKPTPITDILPEGPVFNPQMLQGYGIFHGSHFCPIANDESDGRMHLSGPCTNLYEDPQWAFLKEFSEGTADLDLVFKGGDGFAYFIKGKELIRYDLEKKEVERGRPREIRKSGLFRPDEMFRGTVAAFA